MELNQLEDLVKLAEFLRNPRDISLYRKVENLKHIVLSDKRIRQSLVNGFEMVSFLETSASFHGSLDSSKVDSQVKRDFDINNLYRYIDSMCTSIHQFITPANKYFCLLVFHSQWTESFKF